MKHCVLLILLYITSSITAQNNLNFIGHLDKSGLKKAALREMLWLHHQDRTNENPEIILEIAKSLRALDRNKQALKFYKMYINIAPGDSVALLDAHISRSQLRAASGEYREALFELLLVDDALVQVDSNRYFYNKAFLHLLDKDYTQAGHSFEKLSYISNDDVLSECIQNIEKQANKKHILPRICSYIIPGLGQMYNGNWKDGINSLVLNAAMISLFFNVGTTSTYLDAIFSVGPWFYRYYSGGATNAENASRKKSAQRINTQMQKINTHLLKKSITNE